jgi:predicted DNA-binding transcriptional regulator AlpA
MNEPLLTITDLATVLGTTRKGIYHRRSRGQLPPAIRIGRRVLWRPGDVEAWIASRLERENAPAETGPPASAAASATRGSRHERP